jgi:hypothetical protein
LVRNGWKFLSVKRKAGESPLNEKRRRYVPGRFTEEARSGVRNHINSFPCEVNHYVRAKLSKTRPKYKRTLFILQKEVSHDSSKLHVPLQVVLARISTSTL